MGRPAIRPTAVDCAPRPASATCTLRRVRAAETFAVLIVGCLGISRVSTRRMGRCYRCDPRSCFPAAAPPRVFFASGLGSGTCQRSISRRRLEETFGVFEVQVDVGPRRLRANRLMLRPIRKPPVQEIAVAPTAISSSPGAPPAGATHGPTRRTTTVAESAPAIVARAATTDCPTKAGRTPGGGLTVEFPARMPPTHAVRKPTASQGAMLPRLAGWVGT